jgi:hypothetical protein
MNQFASHWLNFSGQHAGPEDQLQPLTGALLRQVRRQFGETDVLRLTNYSFRRRPSTFPDAVADLDIYDGDGRLAIQGREFPRLIALWAAARNVKASWHDSAPQYVPPHIRLL